MRFAPIAALLVFLACGYSFSQRWTGQGGADRVHAAAFENLSTEPGLGAAITEALRAELARRGADAGEGAPVRIEGEVRAGDAAPATPGAGTWRVVLSVKARLVRGAEVLVERELRREATYLGAGDPLETEGRRTLALRRLAAELAREIPRAFEEG